MNFFSATILSISDITLLISQIIVLSIILARHPSKPRSFIAIIITFILSFCLDFLSYSNSTVIQTIALIINNFSGCFLTLYVFNKFTTHNLLISMIIQFVGFSIHSSIYYIIPTNIREENILLYSIIGLLVRTMLLVVICIFKKTIKNLKIGIILLNIPISVYLLALLSLLIENGLVELINYNTSKTEFKSQIIQLFLTLIVICVSTLIILLIVNVIYKNYYGTISEMLEKQVNIQLDHYTKIEKMNAEIRKFKHDYNNHICCISGLLRARKYDEIREYIETISGQMPSGEFMFKTGNYIADAILSDKQEIATSNSITIEFDGYIPSDINNTDLCIILSNAIDNSIEACCEVAESKIISVYGNCQQGYTILIIKNPTTNTVSGNNLPETTKKDKLHHGFGLSNIENVVAKYNGKMQTSCDNGTFTLSISLENIDAKININV